jgi:hypothetical protein
VGDSLLRVRLYLKDGSFSKGEHDGNVNGRFEAHVHRRQVV